MTTPTIPDSFDADPSVTATAERGQLAHRDHIDNGDRYREELVAVAPGVWTMTGNGLSNQTFVEGPEGLIAIDTGECVEEMAAALAAVRRETNAPVVAVVYTHFHYVGGTRALAGELAEGATLDELPVWGHERIKANRARAVTEVSAAYGRGMVHQFGMMLPAEGPDGLVNVGLGRSFRNPAHAPFTNGFVAPNRPVAEATSTTIAGLVVELTPAPSDSDDSITIWFPELGVCVNNLVWPVLYNVFPIRGEEYRDPRLLLRGIDHILGLAPDHLVGTHGPPMSGREHIEEEATLYRDSIQFLWDQTVRGLNRGLTSGELTESVQLPDCYGRSYPTKQLYGLVEHHVRQIHTGLVGWFDGDEATLFPLPTATRARRLIEGFGGRGAVRDQAREALEGDDLRWALELATWLVRSEVGDDGRADGGTPEERTVLASVLRAIGQRTPSANVRNWCLTRALDLEGRIDLTRFRSQRFSAGEIGNGDPVTYVHALRVLLDPDRTEGVDDEVAWRFPDGTAAGLHVRHGVAVPTDGGDAELVVELDEATFAAVLSMRRTLAEAVEAGDAHIVGDGDRARRVLDCFDLASLRP